MSALELTEDHAAQLANSVFDWVSDEAAATPGKLDDAFVGAVVPLVKSAVLKKIDEIDGVVGA